MRKLVHNQEGSTGTYKLGVTAIEDIIFDLKDRDEITKILIGLQEIFCNKELMHNISALLMNADVGRSDKGREGMDYWTIFVLGILRLSCNWNYDTLYNQYRNHIGIREMTGVDLVMNADRYFSRGAIHENLKLLTVEVISDINILVVKHAHQNIIRGSLNTLELAARCDSYVLLSNVHFPTDFNLLLDSCRKLIDIGSFEAKKQEISGWREHKAIFYKLRVKYLKLTKLRHSNSQDEEKKQVRADYIKGQIREFQDEAQKCVNKVKADMHKFSPLGQLQSQNFLDYAVLFLNQIERRVHKFETIPSKEKVYSIFEPYTEWICKGKAGVRQELGVRMTVIEDQFGFILNSQVMFNQQDVDVAYDITKSTKDIYDYLFSISFDKGYHSKKDKDGNDNRSRIEGLGVKTCLPKKGKRNKAETARESEKEFIKARKQHPAIESAIHALQNHGLARCPDRGVKNFERYAALGILAQNIHNTGKILQQYLKGMSKDKKVA